MNIIIASRIWQSIGVKLRYKAPRELYKYVATEIIYLLSMLDVKIR